MAKILSITSGYPSILYPSVELARRLAHAGHDVTFAGTGEARVLVEHHGLGFLPLPSSRYPQFLSDDANAGFFSRIFKLRHRRQQALASLNLDGFVQEVQRLAPDLLLIDGEMHEHVIAATAVGRPIALLNSFASIWRQPGLPPAHTSVRPGIGWQGTTIGMRLLWFALRLRKRFRAIGLWLRRVGCDRLSILRALARDANFDLDRETDPSQWLMPFTYRRLPVLSLHACEFEFPHTPPERVHYVGPMLLDDRIDRPMPATDRARLDALLERRRGSNERKLIYAGFGATLSTDFDLLRRLTALVELRPDWDLILSLSGQAHPAQQGALGQLSDRVHLFDWLPQREVLEQADAAVTHGGINTIDECVLAGVPLLIYCGFETDMAGNTARVVHHGIGIAGDRQRDTTSRISEHVDQLLTDSSFAINVERLKRAYRAYGEAGVAETTVAALLGTSSPGERA